MQDELKKLTAKQLREKLETLATLIDEYTNEAENIIDELKKRGLKI